MKSQNKHKQHQLWRFIAVVFVVLAYALFTIMSYGVAQGLAVTALTWAFFVFATPVADGGFLVAFPIRLLTGVRMIYTQIGVWLIGGLLVGTYLLLEPGVFQKTPVLQLFYAILTTPWPLWAILILSFIGTLVSIRFDDDVVDVAGSKHKKKTFARNRRKLAYTIAIFSLTVLLYVILLSVTDTHIDFI